MQVSLRRSAYSLFYTKTRCGEGALWHGVSRQQAHQLPPFPGWNPSADSPICRFISHKVFIKFFCISRFQPKSVNLFYMLVIVEDKLTNFGGS